MELDTDTVFFGHRYDFGAKNPVGLAVSARRQHLYLTGQTGTGKSTLLHNLILQDIEAGHGLALIDPHGDLAWEILDHIPSWRTEDVVYFDSAARDPVSINLFRATGDNWHVVAAGIVSAFKKIWGDSWGPRLEYVLYASVAALLQCENTSLLGISRMLSDAPYRAWVARQVKDPAVRSFWVNEFEQYNRTYRQDTIGPIQNKVGQLFLAPPLRNVLGQVQSKVGFRFMMDKRRIFVANLNKGKIGDAGASLLGSLLVTGFELAAMSRADVSSDKRQDFMLCVDEFQHCATDSFASILSEARKYGLHLTLAHQYMGQLSDTLKNAVFGNVGSLIAFRASESDASVLERQFGHGYTRSHFTGLENFEMCVRLLNREPFIGTSFPPLLTSRRRRETNIRRSRERYSARKEIVEKRIGDWLHRRY